MIFSIYLVIIHIHSYYSYTDVMCTAQVTVGTSPEYHYHSLCEYKWNDTSIFLCSMEDTGAFTMIDLNACGWVGQNALTIT